MEVTFPADDPQHDWYVTTGLLVRELISGRMQLGNTLYEQHQPAQLPVAGDPEAPRNQTITYADLLGLPRSITTHRSASRVGQTAPLTDNAWYGWDHKRRPQVGSIQCAHRSLQ